MLVLQKLENVKKSFEDYKSIMKRIDENKLYDILISSIDAEETIIRLQNLSEGTMAVLSNYKPDVLRELKELQARYKALNLSDLDISTYKPEIKDSLDDIRDDITKLHTQVRTIFGNMKDKNNLISYGKNYFHNSLDIHEEELTEEGRAIRQNVLQLKQRHDQFVARHANTLPTDKESFTKHKKRAEKLHELCIELSLEKQGDKTRKRIDDLFSSLEADGLMFQDFRELLVLLSENNLYDEHEERLQTCRVIKPTT